MNINHISPNVKQNNQIPDKVLNPKKILDSLDHDNPEGGNVLEKITGIIDVELKKLSQIRGF